MRTFALLIISLTGLNLNAAVTPEQIQSWQQQAELGDSKAQAMLGWCYYYGEGVAKNETLAAKWITKSTQPRENNNKVEQIKKVSAPEAPPNIQVKVENREQGDNYTNILLVITILIILYQAYKYYKLNDSVESITRDAQKEADQIVKAANTYNEQAVSLHQQRVKELLVREKDARYSIESIEQYKASLQELHDLETALRNRIDGWGDQYILPFHLLLDELADHVGWAEAGQRLKDAREKSRQLIRGKKAVICDEDNAAHEKSATKLMLMAFDSQVDLALEKIKGDENVGKVIQEIKDIYLSLNDYGHKCMNAEITEEYRDARINEAKWGAIAYELRKKEREEQKVESARLREEVQREREIEKAKRDAEREEELTRRALLKAQQDALNLEKQLQDEYERKLREAQQTMKDAITKDEDERIAKEAELRVKMEALLKERELQSVEQHAKFEAEKQELEKKLKELEGNQRALSMAQQTKSGHVYVISNVGSFGDAVFKVGMTRRLDPMDRIWELGDASVPFQFDIHAMIKSEDAPGLESKLHNAMAKARVNKVNLRKEYFRLPVSEIRILFEQLGVNAEWTMASKAHEYRETLALEEAFKKDPAAMKKWMGETEE